MVDIVSKLWGFCHTLRHDGIDYGERGGNPCGVWERCEEEQEMTWGI